MGKHGFLVRSALVFLTMILGGSEAYAGRGGSGGLYGGKYCVPGLDNTIGSPTQITSVDMLGPRKISIGATLPSDNDHTSMQTTVLFSAASSTTLDTYDPKRTWYYNSGAGLTSYPVSPVSTYFLEGPGLETLFKPGAALKAIAVTYDSSYCAVGRSKVFSFTVPAVIPPSEAPTISNAKVTYPANFAGPYPNVNIEFNTTSTGAVKYATVDVDGNPDTLLSCDWYAASNDPDVGGRYPNSSNLCAGWATHLDASADGPSMGAMLVNLRQGDPTPHKVVIRAVNYDGAATTLTLDGVTGIAPK